MAPEEVLPDDEEDKDNQTSHLVITNELLFNGKIGLIVKSTLNDNVGQKGVLHYVDHVTSGNLDHFQGIIYNSQGGQKLGFALEVIENKMVIRFKILNKYTILCNDKNARLTKLLKRIDFLYRQRKIVEKEMLSDRNRVVNIYTKCTRLLRVGRL